MGRPERTPSTGATAGVKMSQIGRFEVVGTGGAAVAPDRAVVRARRGFRSAPPPRPTARFGADPDRPGRAPFSRMYSALAGRQMGTSRGRGLSGSRRPSFGDYATAPSCLARKFHQLPAADADPCAVTGRTPSRRFDVVSATPSASLGPCGQPQRRLDALATKAGEICGLVHLHRGLDCFRRHERVHWRAGWGRPGRVLRERGGHRTTT